VNSNLGNSRAESAAILSLGTTVVVVVIKLVAGFLSGSISVLAEAFQSSVDVAVSFGVLKAVQYAAKPPDEDHPYGHGKAEVLLSAMQMLLILTASGFIIVQAYHRLFEKVEIVPVVGMVALAAVTAVNYLLSAHLARVATATGSVALKAEVLHLRSDAIASIGIFCGLILVKITGQSIFDPIIAIGFTLWVVYVALRQLRGIAHQLMDGALPESDLRQLETVLSSHKDVRGYHNVRTRSIGSDRYVELHVLLDDHLTFVDAHRTAEHVERDLSSALDGAHVTIHYEPMEDELRHRELVHGDSVKKARGKKATEQK
jgi:cation diffusion facilitator family transporter